MSFAPTITPEIAHRLLRIRRMAFDTFATPDDAEAWMKRPHPMLQGESPMQCAGSDDGARRVQDFLVAIKHGGAL